jgi:hypothetical protein
VKLITYFRLATKQVCLPSYSYSVAALCQGQAYRYHFQTRRSITTFTNTRTLQAIEAQQVSWRCILVLYYNGGIFARRRKGAFHGGNRRLNHKFSVLSVSKEQGIEKLRIEEVSYSYRRSFFTMAQQPY